MIAAYSKGRCPVRPYNNMALFTTDKLADKLEKSLRDLKRFQSGVVAANNTKLDPFVISPKPDLDKLRKKGGASIDLRLGTWFSVFIPGRVSLFDLRKSVDRDEGRRMTKMHYVPFGDYFVLHPRSFVLGVTLEWIRLPSNMAGYVTSRSSWGRRGLIIATASGVHPGFCGCLTLELTNVGEAPIALYPGSDICQFFIHDTLDGEYMDRSRFVGKRKPSLGSVEFDNFAMSLATFGCGSQSRSGIAPFKEQQQANNDDYSNQQ